MSDTYNGWKNRSTCNAVLWIDNEEPRYRARIAYTPKGTWTAEKAREFCAEQFGTKTPDGCRVADVDFQEIATAWNEE